MITPVVQRWRSRRDLYRPAGETIVTAHYEVAAIPDDRTAKAFVEANHYSSSYPAARFRHGLYWGGLLVGVAVFSVPMQGAVLDRLPCPREAAVELGRFVLLDRVAANGETWMLARCFELLRREGIEGVVSFSDPMPRALARRCILAGSAIGDDVLDPFGGSGTVGLVAEEEGRNATLIDLDEHACAQAEGRTAQMGLYAGRNVA